MNEIRSIQILPVAVTLCTFYVGVIAQRKLKTYLCSPILVAVVLILGFLSATGMDLETFQAGNTYFSWLLAPATVSLAVPLYEHFQILRKNTKVLFASIAAGAISCLAMVLACGVLLKLDREMILSLLPKSVTTAIGVPLSEMIGGIGPITTAAILVTGVTASVLGPALCKMFRLTDEIAQGVAYGTAGHVVGTSKAMECSALAGAAGSFSLVVAGLLTAVVMPAAVSLLA